MKLFTINLLLAATFAMPVVAMAKESKVESQVVAERKLKALNEALAEAKKKNIQEEKAAGKYRLVEMNDPNEIKSENRKSWSVGPWFGDKRQRILTPVEARREDEEGKCSTNTGSQVCRYYSTIVGAKVKVKLGARQ